MVAKIYKANAGDCSLGETFVLFCTDHYLQPFVNNCTFQLAVSKSLSLRSNWRCLVMKKHLPKWPGKNSRRSKLLNRNMWQNALGFTILIRTAVLLKETRQSKACMQSCTEALRWGGPRAAPKAPKAPEPAPAAAARNRCLFWRSRNCVHWWWNVLTAPCTTWRLSILWNPK